MKKIVRLFSLLFLASASLFLSTCKKDDPQKPTISAVTPSSGHEGDVIKISGTFLGSTQKIRFGSLEGVVIDPKGEEVTTQVPAGAPLGKVDVIVETEGGPSNAISFTVIPPAPIINSINPIQGSAGMTVAITGKFFTTAKEVSFGTVKVTIVDPKTETQVTVKVPDGAPLGATDVKVTSEGGISNAISFTILEKPTITDFSPQSGPAGTHVLITGAGLGDATEVDFGSTKGTFTPVSGTQLDAVVPASATTGKIKVITPGGEALSATDFVTKGAPSITSFLPLTGIVGGEVTLTGENFSVAGAVVKFGGIPAITITVNSDTEIKATVPANAVTGKISVTTNAGTGTSTNDFTVIPAPAITSFTPVLAAIGGTVTITGTNFISVSAVKFNGVAAITYTVNSATQITVTVPAGASSGTLSVVTPAGTGTSSTSFTVQGAPTVTNFTPTSGIVGTSIAITGTNFTGVTSVKFASTELAAGNFTFNSATQITAKVPPGAATGVITVTTPAGSGASSSIFTVTGGPTVTLFNPTSGIIGASIVVTGTNFNGATSVKFNNTAATFVVNNSTQITAPVPVGASNGVISVTTPAGTGSSSGSFTIIGAPTVTSFTPLQGAVGINVTITGTTFTGATSVKFNATEVGVGNYTVNTATSITAKVPVGATNGPISVTTPAGTGTSANNFTIIPPPTVTSFAPTSGAVGQSITITGTSFISVTAVKFNGVSAVAPITNSTTQITATIPAGATTGKISVETAAGTGLSANNFTVAGVPTVTSFTPTSGPVAATITVNGTNFVNVSSVKFNGTESGMANIVVNSALQLTAKVPAGATNGTISVTTPSGTGTSAATFTIILPPTITNFTPPSGLIGASVVITGTSFTGTTSVKFNNTSATYTVNNPTQITATVPAGATTGKISVTNPAAAAMSANNFTVLAAPIIGSISPITGIVGTTLTILGSNLANATSVKFNAVTVSSLISNTDSEIKVTVPALGLGAVNVSVVTPGGTSNTKTFTVLAAPVISSLKPNVSYKGFPIMILGSNLAGTVGVSIGGTPATVMTAYDASVIATLPGSIANGTYTVTVSNEGGPSNGLSLNIITAPGGVGAPPTGTFVSPPPANFVNAISNQWSYEDNPNVSVFLLSAFGSTCQIENPSYEFGSSPTDQYVCGSYVFTKNGAGNVTGNYVELTIGIGHPAANLETFVGQWSATVPDPCIQKLFLISTKDGHVLSAIVDVSQQITYPSGTCH